jgi:hypothetical protein
MPTVGKEIADAIAKGDGHYEDDPRVERIVEYTNMAGDLAYGLEYEGQGQRYVPSPYVNNPRTYWEKKCR